MELTTGYFVYAGLYRLAVIAAGIVAIVLGYRLFLKGGGASAGETAPSGTTATAKSGNFEFSVRNAAPGTCFSLFGAALIVAMVIEAGPELAVQSGQSGSGQSISLKGPSARGASGPLFESRWRDAEKLLRRGDRQGAVGAFGTALSADDASVQDVARAAAAIASIYLDQQRAQEALALARLAVQISPDNSSVLETLSRAADANGQSAEAVAAKRRAAALRK